MDIHHVSSLPPQDHAAYLTSVFWGSFSIGRLLGIPLSRALTPTMLLLADVFLTVVSAMGLILSGRKIPSILWACSATLGLGEEGRDELSSTLLLWSRFDISRRESFLSYF